MVTVAPVRGIQRKTSAKTNIRIQENMTSILDQLWPALTTSTTSGVCLQGIGGNDAPVGGRQKSWRGGKMC